MLINKLNDLRAANNEDGFTLIELMIVVVIIGILAAFAIPVFSDAQKKAIGASLKSDVTATAGNVALYLVGSPTASDLSGVEKVVSEGNTVTVTGGWTSYVVRAENPDGDPSCWQWASATGKPSECDPSPTSPVTPPAGTEPVTPPASEPATVISQSEEMMAPISISNRPAGDWDTNYILDEAGYQMNLTSSVKSDGTITFAFTSIAYEWDGQTWEQVGRFNGTIAVEVWDEQSSISHQVILRMENGVLMNANHSLPADLVHALSTASAPAGQYVVHQLSYLDAQAD